MSYKIAICPQTLGTGGIGQNTLNLSDGFLRLGHSVDLLFTNTTPSPRDEMVNPRIRTVHLSNRTRYAIPSIIKYIKNEQPDLVITAHHNVNIAFTIAKKLLRKRYSFHLVCTFRTHHSMDKREGVKSSIFFSLAKVLYRSCDTLVAVSQGVASDLQHCGFSHKRGIKVIYNPAYPAHAFEPNSGDLPPPHSWLASTETKTIITAARLTAQKNLSTLLHAFHLVEQQNRKARLLILGTGEQERNLKKLASDLRIDEKVSFLGHTPNPLNYLRHADVFALSSDWEGFGNVLVEALAVGLPVVSTDCPSGPSEILENGTYGTLVPPGDAAALADGILDMLNNPIDSMKSQNRAAVFCREIIAQDYLSLLDSRS